MPNQKDYSFHLVTLAVVVNIINIVVIGIEWFRYREGADDETTDTPMVPKLTVLATLKTTAKQTVTKSPAKAMSKARRNKEM